MIRYYAGLSIPDRMRRTMFIDNARRALVQGNTRRLQEYLDRVRFVRGGKITKGQMVIK
jgi:hypothetical protein